MTKRFILSVAALLVAPHLALAQAPSADAKQLAGMISPADKKTACAGGREAVVSAVRIKYGEVRAARVMMPPGAVSEAVAYILQTECKK